MNLQLTIGAIVLIVVGLAIVAEVYRLRSTKSRRRPGSNAPVRRSAQLEKRMVAAFEGPRKHYGDCFAEFSVWRQPESTRMDVRTKHAWQLVDKFYRSMIVRHLWQSLAELVKGPVVINVDKGAPYALVWTEAETAKFNDRGVVAPWVPAKGRVGTLLSGP